MKVNDKILNEETEELAYIILNRMITKDENEGIISSLKLQTKTSESSSSKEDDLEEIQKREVEKFVKKFCRLCGYKKESDAEYANKFFIKTAFVENNINDKCDKKLLFLIISEYGILFECDFDIYNSHKFEYICMNGKCNNQQKQDIIYEAFNKIKDKYTERMNECLDKYVDYLHTRMVNYKLSDKQKVEAETEEKFIDFCHFSEDEKKYFYSHVVKDLISEWSWLNLKDSGIEKYERNIKKDHFNLLKQAKKNHRDLNLYWKNALSWIIKMKENERVRLYDIDMITEDMCNQFLKEYIRPIIGEDIDISKCAEKMRKNAEDHDSVLMGLYNIICRCYQIRKEDKNRIKRMLIWISVCHYFSQFMTNISYEDICYSPEMFCFWKSMSSTSVMPDWEFYDKIDNCKAKDFALCIPVIKLGYIMRKCLDYSMPYKLGYIAVKDPILASTNLIEDYISLYPQQYESLLNKINSFEQTISIYKILWNNPFFTREYRRRLIERQIFRIKELVDVSDESIWLSSEFVKKVSPETRKKMINNRTKEAQALIFESAIQKHIQTKAKKKLYKALVDIFNEECK